MTCCDSAVEGAEVVPTGMVRVVGRVVPNGTVVPPSVGVTVVVPPAVDVVAGAGLGEGDGVIGDVPVVGVGANVGVGVGVSVGVGVAVVVAGSGGVVNETPDTVVMSVESAWYWS